MNKFLAVFKNEYLKIIKSWTFVVGTITVPLMALIFTAIPTFLMTLQGDAVKLTIVDQDGKIAQRIKENLSPEKILEKAKEATAESLKNISQTQEDKMRNSASQIGGSFIIEIIKPEGKNGESIRSELNEKIKTGDLDAYLIVPEDLASEKAPIFRFFARNTSDIMTSQMLEQAINQAVRTERMSRENLDEEILKKINRKVGIETTKVSERGEEKDSGSGFLVAFAISFMIYLVLTLYGNAIMGAIIEEKETKISEVLFSSAKPFELMLGKLVGVGLAGLTQVGIWMISASALLIYGISSIQRYGIDFQMPEISPLFFVYFVIFFLLGFFTYGAVFGFMGSIFPTLQEASQFAVIPVLLMLGGFYAMFPLTRDPNSTYSFVFSIIPFISPMAMPTRIVIEMPPFWQILLSITINLISIFVLTWITAKVYRVGMLMYGKRPTIQEIWRWILAK